MSSAHPDEALCRLLGELAAATCELQDTPEPAYVASTRERFASFYQYGERGIAAAIAAGIAVSRAGALAPDLLAPLWSALAGTSLLDLLLGGLTDVFDYMGYDEGYFYWARSPWAQVCMLRSALGFMRELLAGHPALLSQLDLTDLDERLEKWAFELRVTVPVPPGMPSTHWWWFQDHPP